MRANSVEGVKRGRDAGVVGWERRGRGVDVIRKEKGDVQGAENRRP